MRILLIIIFVSSFIHVSYSQHLSLNSGGNYYLFNSEEDLRIDETYKAKLGHSLTLGYIVKDKNDAFQIGIGYRAVSYEQDIVQYPKVGRYSEESTINILFIDLEIAYIRHLKIHEPLYFKLGGALGESVYCKKEGTYESTTLSFSSTGDTYNYKSGEINEKGNKLVETRLNLGIGYETLISHNLGLNFTAGVSPIFNRYALCFFWAGIGISYKVNRKTESDPK